MFENPVRRVFGFGVYFIFVKVIIYPSLNGTSESFVVLQDIGIWDLVIFAKELEQLSPAFIQIFLQLDVLTSQAL
jgi:hypothetical protein